MSDAFLKIRLLWFYLRQAYEDWKSQVWRADLDQNFCCDGRECGCRGVSVRQAYLHEKGQPNDQ